jgi:hypothetical protein
MKKLFISVCALAALAGCSTEKEEIRGVDTDNARTAIAPSANIENNVISRAAVDGTSFAEGNDVFRLSAFEAATEPTDNWTADGAQAFENMQVNCAANGSLSLATPKYYPPTGTNAQKLWFYAYAPSTNGTYSNGNGTTKPSVTYTITGQEDIMAGKVTNGNGIGGVAKGETQKHPAFGFSHLLKKITFKVKAGDTFDADASIQVTNITVKGVKTSATLDVVAGTLTFSGEANQSLTLSGGNTMITTEGASVPGCLMFERGTSFTVSVTAGGVTYADATVTLSGDKAGEAGVSHEVTLTFHRSGIVPTAVITDWVKGDDAGVDIQ